MHEAGLAKADITIFEPGIAMMGWGLPEHQARRVAEPLHARALCVRDEHGGVVCFVSVELLIVSRGLWLEVVNTLREEHPELGLDAHNLTLTATHTHSAPSGFAHSFFLQLNAPGFSRTVHDGLHEAIVDVIVRAHADLAPARLVLATGEVPREAGIAWNRSWFAYRRNPEADHVTKAERDRAIHRTMTLLRVERPDGRVVGLVDWFGLHNTCVHSDKDALHSDHKGLASAQLEREHDLIAIMAQECAGDVTPNHRPDPERGYNIGPHDDDHESAAAVAAAQVAVVEALLASEGEVIEGPVGAVSRLVDFSGARADARFTLDGVEHVTGPGAIGLSMTMGTAEGPGPLWPARRALAGLYALRRGLDAIRGLWGGRRHDPRIGFLDVHRGSDGRVLGVLPIRHLPALDPVFAWIRDRVRSGDAGDGPWMPPVMPVQLLRLGQLAILATPNEPTTISGVRLRRTVLEAAPEGVRHAVISPYANAYAGYLTTAEEYQVQHYEAGYTLYGPHTLAALQTVADELAGRLDDGSALLGEVPPRTPREALDRMAYVGPWPA